MIESGVSNPIRAGRFRMGKSASRTLLLGAAFLAAGAARALGQAQCTESPTTLCLGNGRFAVTATWTNPQSQTGAGNAVKLTDDSGYFWFFDQANIEMVVKVLDGCAINNAYWV